MAILQSFYCCCTSAKQLAVVGGIYSLVSSNNILVLWFECKKQQE